MITLNVNDAAPRVLSIAFTIDVPGVVASDVTGVEIRVKGRAPIQVADEQWSASGSVVSIAHELAAGEFTEAGLFHAYVILTLDGGATIRSDGTFMIEVREEF